MIQSSIIVPEYVVGCDLGQAHDPTALVVVEPSRDSKPVVDVRDIQRVPLGTHYPAIVAHLAAVAATLRAPVPLAAIPGAAGAQLVQIDGRPHLVGSSRVAVPVPRPKVSIAVDYTGVGRPVFDMLLAARPDATLIPITITSGNAVLVDPVTMEQRVPKRDLAALVAVLLSEGRLRIAGTLPMAAALTAELAAFRVKINEKTGHDSYEAGGESWREGGAHDDLVLALAIACWCCARVRNQIGIW